MKYIFILIVYLLIAIILQVFFRTRLWNNKQEKKAIIAWLILIFFAGIVTVYHASTLNKVWIFPGNGIIGIRFLNLPIEEYFFLLVVPYFAIALYKFLVKTFLTEQKNN